MYIIGEGNGILLQYSCQIMLLNITYNRFFQNSNGGGLVTKSCPTPVTLWPVACRAHLSMGFFLQGIFLTQELNPGLLHCRQILYQRSYEGSPRTVIVTHYLMYTTSFMWTSWVVEVVKNCPAIRDMGWIPGQGRFPGGEHGNSLQQSHLENPMDREAQ